MNTSVATNLSFLYYLEKDYINALKYANMGIEIDGYNSKAMISKGNCCIQTNNLDSAKECFLNAVSVDTSSPEALYNLALVNKQLKLYPEALSCFTKLHTTLHDNPEVLFNIANMFAIYDAF